MPKKVSVKPILELRANGISMRKTESPGIITGTRTSSVSRTVPSSASAVTVMNVELLLIPYDYLNLRFYFIFFNAKIAV